MRGVAGTVRGRVTPGELLRRFGSFLVRKAIGLVAARTAARVDIWHLIRGLLLAGFSLRVALRVAIEANEGNLLRCAMLRRWQLANAGDVDDFVAELKRWVPATEAMIFFGMGRVPPPDLFAAAARVGEMRARQTRAVLSALTVPLLLGFGCLVLVWFVGGFVMPELQEVSSPHNWSGFAVWVNGICSGFYENDVMAAVVLSAVVAVVWLVVLRWTGPGRRMMDKVAPFNLYRILSGSAFLFICLEFLRLGVDLNANTFARLAEGASPYVRSRIRAIAWEMTEQGKGFGKAMKETGTGFPDPVLVAVASALDGQVGWDRELAGFVDRWIDRSEATMNARAVMLNMLLLAVAAGVMIAVPLAVFEVMSQAGDY